MARATRSAATTSAAPNSAEKDKQPAADSPPTSRKGASKKRKRNSNAEHGDSPPTKHARTDSKEEGTPEPDAQPDTQPEEKKEVIDLPSSGDVPIQSTDAASILEVLEMVDNQGLLDRVFPLPNESPKAEPSESSSTSPPTMLSFRSLLQNSSEYPLSVLRAAVKHLYPISSHPRSRPSEPAAQQLRFCNLAISLLDQASHHNAPVPLHVESLIADGDTGDVEDAAALSQASSSGLRPRKYALVQHLPTGDWWSSVSSTPPTAEREEKDLKNLYTAKADLVAIFPSASGSELAHKHTLGDYVAKRPSNAAHYKPPPPRRVSCGKFLYHGPYASFAPCFDQDGVEVGRVAMGEVIFQQEMKRRLRALAKGKRRAFVGASAAQTEDTEADVQDASDESFAGPSVKKVDVSKGLEELLPQEEVEAIKAALGTLEMEQAVDELLQRNARALQRLEELQLERFRAQGEGSSIVEVGSEEWDVAQGIIDSLSLLASLRPRPSNGDTSESPLVPSPSILHKLQRTLPIGATEGWYGTLPEGRTTAFRDDTTVHVRSSASVTAKSTAATTAAVPTTLATPVKAPVATAAATTPYTPYTYPSTYQSSQYRGGYGTYTPTGGTGTSTGTTYYPSYTNTTSTTAAAAAAPTSHYPNAQYGTAAGQGAYAYSPWYGYQGQATASGRSTPQPAQGANYASYYATGTGQRAVANTAKPSYAAPAWNAGTGAATAGAGAGTYVAPTLPPHMRSAVAGAAAAGTTTPPSGYGGYYGGYQAPR
ncbi:hypothetical protein OH77DRAFT_1448294 [Trametes cingulata]|nr:hypothetical protein OH77DRAFT_1448294 [Trametes cingulata]